MTCSVPDTRRRRGCLHPGSNLKAFLPMPVCRSIFLFRPREYRRKDLPPASFSNVRRRCYGCGQKCQKKSNPAPGRISAHFVRRGCFPVPVTNTGRPAGTSPRSRTSPLFSPQRVTVFFQIKKITHLFNKYSFHPFELQVKGYIGGCWEPNRSEQYQTATD